MKAVEPHDKLPSEPGFVYHATTQANARDIATTGLKVHRPWEGTDQEVWPDGSREKRNYFAPKAHQAYAFVPEGGPGALLRVHSSKHPTKVESGTGDVVSTKPVSPHHLEILTDEGWHPLRRWAGLEAPSPQLSLPFAKSMQKLLALAELRKSIESLAKMALIHNDPKRPKTVYRVQDEQGEGPYGSSGLDFGVPQTKIQLPERGNKDFHQPLPEHDFTPEDHEELMGQGPEGNGAGYYSFAFERPQDAVRWFGHDGIHALYQHGYRVKEVPASKVYRSASGKQVFFEHHPSTNPAKAKDAQDFQHPLPPPKAIRRKAMAKSERTQADWNEVARRNMEALRAGAGGPTKPQWRTRPILDAEDAKNLDHAAAAHALRTGSAEEGERMAYEQYQRNHRLDSAAHHYHAAAKAQAGGNRELAQRHLLSYAKAARELGLDPLGKPSPEVGERIRQLGQKKRGAGYRSHPADSI